MKKVVLLTILSIYFIACDSLKVVSNYDKEVDFSQYSTARFYGWKNNSDAILTDLDKKFIEEAFLKEFNKRGVNFVKDEESDLIVSLFIVTEKKTNYTETNTYPHAYRRGYYGYGYGGYYGYGPGYGWGGAYRYSDIQEVEYTEGTMIVSVYDAAKKEIVWESVAKGTVDPKNNKRQKSIEYSVGKIMYKFPKKIVRNK